VETSLLNYSKDVIFIVVHIISKTQKIIKKSCPNNAQIIRDIKWVYEDFRED